jgi:hypothetical protein
MPLNPGDTSLIHNISVPNTFDNWATEYGELVEKADARMCVVVEEASELAAYETNNLPNHVLAYVMTDGEFYVSDYGTFQAQGAVGGDDLLTMEGGVVKGTLDFNSHSDAKLVLPVE